MIWFLITIIAYFLYALVAVIDKYLISKRLPQPAVYAFFVGILGILAIFLIPFGFHLPSFPILLLSFIAGLSFTFALFYLFNALKFEETTKIIPFMGGLQPIFIFILSFVFLKEKLANTQLTAFVFLVLGTIFITFDFHSKKFLKEKGVLCAFVSTFLFALSYFLTKAVYQKHPFISSFVWIRLGSFFGALSFLISGKIRQKLINTIRPRVGRRRGTSFIFFFGQACGALSFFLINYAIKLNSVSLVNALQATQYIFLLIMTIIISKNFPQVLEEKSTFENLRRKVIAIIFIGLGLWLIAL